MATAAATVAATVPVVGAAQPHADRTSLNPGRPLYVGHRDSSFFAEFSIGPRGGLNLRRHVASGKGPIAITFTPDGRTAYVADVFSSAIGVYAVGPRGGLTETRPRVRAGVVGPSGLAVAPDGRTLYVANQDASRLEAFRIGADGRPTRLGRSIPSGSLLPRDLALTPDGRFLFASHWSTAAGKPAVVTGFAVRRNGTLRPRGRVHVGVDAGALTISPDGRHLYVDAQTSGQVFGFAVAHNGSLRPVPGSPVSAGHETEGAAMTPDGRHLYVTNVTRKGRVWGFTVGASGRLTRVPGSPFRGGDGPEGIGMTPDGRHIYTANSGSHNVSAYTIGARGRLTSLGRAVPTGGVTPAAFRGVVALPNQGPTAEVAADPRRNGRSVRFDATASSDPDGRVARYIWDFGDDGTVLRNPGATPTHAYDHAGRFRVTLTAVDNEGCSTGLVFTGQTALCNGSPAAQARRTVTVGR